EKGVPVPPFECIEEIAVPDVEADREGDLQQGQADDGAGQQPRRPALFRGKIGRRQRDEAAQKPPRLLWRRLRRVLARSAGAIGRAAVHSPAPGAGTVNWAEPE